MSNFNVPFNALTSNEEKNILKISLVWDEQFPGWINCALNWITARDGLAGSAWLTLSAWNSISKVWGSVSILPSSEIKDHLLWPIWWWPFDVYLFHWFFIKLDIGLRLSNQTKYEDKNKEIRGKSITKYIHLTRKQHAFLGNDTLSNFQIQ